MTVSVRAKVDPAAALDAAIRALRTNGSDLPIEEVERALEATPHDARLWHVKGLMHRQQDHRDLAIPALRRAVQLAPQEPLIAHGYARTLYEAGLPSVLEHAHAMKLARDNLDLVKGLVGALIAEHRVADAIEGMQLALSRAPFWGEGHTLLAQLRWLEGEREGFTRHFDEALALYPKAHDLRRLQLIALVHAEQWDEVTARIARGRAAMGDDLMFDVSEAILHSELGNADLADAKFAALAHVNDPALQVRRVRHLLCTGRIQPASEMIDEWLPRPEGFMFWPYASIAWRLTDPARWEWLEGHESFVGVYDIGDRLPPLDQLTATLRNLHTLSGQPLEQSLRGGTQTDGNIFTHIDPVLVQLREAIRDTVAEHVAKFPAPDPSHPLLGVARSPIRFQGAWSVRLHTKGYHANHVHPAGWISSALYIVLPPDLGQEDAGFLTLGEARSEGFKIDLPPFRTVEPKPGRLVLFPSYMWHGTRPFSEGERMTVAFDVARGPAAA
jgi:tetratricopeptide (TPR) repeat protein